VHEGTYTFSSDQTAPLGCLHCQKEKRKAGASAHEISFIPRLITLNAFSASLNVERQQVTLLRLLLAGLAIVILA
jgi:hypothetical protein